MERMSFTYESELLHRFRNDMMDRGMNVSAALESLLVEGLRREGLENAIRKHGVERVEHKTPPKTKDGKFVRKNMNKVPSANLSVREATRALNKKFQKALIMTRREGSKGYDEYRVPYSAKIVNDNIKVVWVEGQAEYKLAMSTARLRVTDGFGFPVTKDGLNRSIAFYAEDIHKMCRTVYNLPEIKNVAVFGWFSKYSLLKSDKWIKEIKNDKQREVAELWMLLVYARHINVIDHLVSKKKFCNARKYDLDRDLDNLKKRCGKAAMNSQDGMIYDLLNKLGVKTKKERG